MKIHKLEITGFGPFKNKQVIDFDALTADGIFMLEGPTGSGKSSIIDAIVWVLYGTTAHESANSIQISISGRVRSDYVGTDEETRVLMEFSAQGHRYRIQRTPTYFATKTRGDGEKKVNATARLEFVKPSAQSLTRIDEVGSRVKDILGMGREQFSQLVVLPQGDFAAFLHASSEKRQEILESIFRTHFYKDMEKYFESRRKEHLEEIKSLNFDIRRHAQNLEQEAAEDSDRDFDDSMEIFLDPNEANDKKISLLQEIVAELSPNPKKDLTSKAQLEAKINPIRDEITRLADSKKQIKEKAEKEAKLRDLLANQEDVDEVTEQLALREKVLSAEADLEHRASAEKDLEKAQARFIDEYEDATASEITKEIAKTKAKHTALLKKTSQNESLDKLYDAATAQLKAIDEQDTAKVNLKLANSEISKAKKEIEICRQLVADLKLREKNEYAHIVAKKLRPGVACPVCGSKEHPKKLKSSGTFSTKALEEAEFNFQEWRDYLTSMESLKRESTKLIGKKLPAKTPVKSEIAKIEKQMKDIENDDWEFDQVAKLLRDLEKALPYYVEAERASKEYDKFDQRIERVLTKFDLGEDELEELLDMNPIPSQKIIDKHNSDLIECQTFLKQEKIKKLPSPEGVEEKLADLSKRKTVLDSELAEVSDRIALANKILKNLELAVQGITNALKEISSKNVLIAPYLDLDAWVNGKNILDLKLSSYVLQERLEMVLERASNHLRRVSHGKYEFRLNEERVGRQRIAGLGIQIMDYRAGKERLAETLSGGETFYASLSLALGLAEVVKAEEGGLELGTLFIDEGFGSLSEETLSEVIDVLEELRSAERIIGIISHVEGMKTQIPLRIEVRASDEGPSSIRFATAEMQ
jgi:exonuclease SbcC